MLQKPWKQILATKMAPKWAKRSPILQQSCVQNTFTIPKLDKSVAKQVPSHIKSQVSLAESAFSNAGKESFGSDINKIASESADISRNL